MMTDRRGAQSQVPRRPAEAEVCRRAVKSHQGAKLGNKADRLTVVGLTLVGHRQISLQKMGRYLVI